VSQENVESVQAMWAAWGTGDYDAALGAFAEDSVWDDTLFRPDGAVHRGLAALIAVSRTWRQAWEHYEIEAEEVLDAGDDRVAVLLRDTAEGRGGGVAVTNRWGVVQTVHAGKIVHTMVYPSPEEVLGAVGLQKNGG
jgi:ketosteroid isomerase-like protein